MDAQEQKSQAQDFAEEWIKKHKQVRKMRRGEEKAWAFSITSLMDALTILLIFLLVTLTSDPLNIKQDSHLLLAKSTAPVDATEHAIPVTVKKGFIAVDQKEVVRIDCRLADGRTCTNDIIERRTFCDMYPEQCDENEKKLLETMKFEVAKTYKENGDENSFLIVPLYNALEEKVKEQQQENKELGREFKGIVDIIADRDMPFRLITEVVHSAGQAGLSTMRFAVIKSSTR
jgi:biopolymer transport protein ExbD